MKYFILISVCILAFIIISFLLRKFSKKKSPQLKIERSCENPILSPGNRTWTTQGTFNPAAVKADNGDIHLLYRAMGDDGISRLGHAWSTDGVNFNEDVPYPVFTLLNPRANAVPADHQTYDIQKNPSGGGWSGSEDPRMVEIDGRIYVTFNAFDGWDFVRVAVISINEKDFYAQKFNWSDPILLSPKGQVHKNWVFFPEKINGKFAILHSISPEVQIDYVNNLDDIKNGKQVINSKFGQKTARPTWDTYVRGAGPSPLRTKKGWLVLYHAVDKKYPNQYRLGAMLLDLKNPTKVIARSPEPLLVPEMWYENDWKPGVVYACGAVIKGKDLLIYYGGGDRHVCVAKTDVHDLLEWIIRPKKNK
ncbi:MAG: hypothetical protein RLZZ67_294 [Candidatus Parcubacteria bacterium]|jgi:predicted GH43/DUF377 family glycosyl hydrolase